MLAAAAARALCTADLPPWLLVSLLVGVVVLALLDHRAKGRLSTLSLHADDSWQIEQDGIVCFRGGLLDAGTRSARSLTLVLEAKAPPMLSGSGKRRPDSFAPVRRRVQALSILGRPARQRLSVHADSVTDREFSFLHLQLMLAGDPDVPYTGAGP